MARRWTLSDSPAARGPRHCILFAEEIACHARCHRSVRRQEVHQLETFRKNGAGVRTPVWFAQQSGDFLLYSAPDAGKVKRIRNNPKVRVAPCDIRGNLRGAWVDARASPCDPAESERDNSYSARNISSSASEICLTVDGSQDVLIAIHFD